MLPKHPDQLPNNEDLDKWICSLITNKEPEGIRLDYKQTINIGTPKENREIAKDVASFANEIGGTLIYGIPQEDSASAGAPIPTTPYGMDPVIGLEERIENILSTTISPMLPEFRIRRVDLSEYPGKVAYIVWTPESWVGPHMVHGYEDGRYYRRGQFRAVIMSERDVEDRYHRRLSMRTAASAFSESHEATHLGNLFNTVRARTALLITPMLLLPNRIPLHQDTLLLPNRIPLHQDTMRSWLNAHPWGPQWLPSMNGARSSWVDSNTNDREEIEIHRNGAIAAHWYTKVTAQSERKSPEIAYYPELNWISRGVRFAGDFYQFINYTSQVSISVVIHCPPGDKLFLQLGPKNMIPLEPSGTDMKLTIECGAQDLVTKPEAIEQAVANGLFRAFSRWEAPAFKATLFNP